MKRRQYLAGATAGVAGLLAGCTDAARSQLGIGTVEARWNFEWDAIARGTSDFAILVLGTVRNTGQRTTSFDLNVQLVDAAGEVLQNQLVTIEELAVDETQQWYVEFSVTLADGERINDVEVSSPDLDSEPV